jgi:hypothetical protein
VVSTLQHERGPTFDAPPFLFSSIVGKPGIRGMMSVAEASNSIEQAKHGGDHSSRPAQLQARENEQKALSLWIKGATFQHIAAAGFGIEL